MDPRTVYGSVPGTDFSSVPATDTSFGADGSGGSKFTSTSIKANRETVNKRSDIVNNVGNNFCSLGLGLLLVLFL